VSRVSLGGPDLSESSQTPPVIIARRDPVDPTTLESVREVFLANGSEKELAHLDWQYVRPPAGPAYVVQAQADTSPPKIAALYVAFPVDVQVGRSANSDNGSSEPTRRRRIVQSLDTITDSHFRGRGLFVQLGRETYAWCRSEGAVAVYGFPNANSVHGFVRHLNWHLLDPTPFMIRPIGGRYLRARLNLRRKPIYSRESLALPRRVEELDHIPSDLNSLWQAFSSTFEIGIVRDDAYLAWRLFERPNSWYRVFISRSPQSELTGLVAYSMENKHGGTIGYLLELMVHPEHKGDGTILARMAVRHLRQRGADLVLAWNLRHSPTRPALRRAGFLPLPRLLRPIELHFGVGPFTEDEHTRALLLDRHSWYLSYLDSDTV
jgi:GNAT superfamily N-acetyltransferase